MPAGVRISVERTVVKKIGAILFSLLVFLQLTGGYSIADEVQIRHPRFSAKNDKLVFNYCRKTVPCTIGLYDLRRGSLSYYQAPQNEIWADANFSPDGTKLAFIVIPIIDHERDLTGQVAIMTSDGSGIRRLTNSPTYKSSPSFSPDGKRIIYARAEKRREEGARTPVADYDIYEVDSNGEPERRLTNLMLYEVSAPFYLPDGKHFIFSSYGDACPRKAFDELKLCRKQYKEQYQLNSIFITVEGGNTLRPAFVNGDFSDAPYISNDGSKILFKSITNKMDGVHGLYNYDIFLRKDGVNNRLTQLRTFLYEIALSPDGTHIAFLSDKERNKKPTLWVMNSDGAGLMEIKIPMESKPVK
jgi:Tol biopolymer transport system component